MDIMINKLLNQYKVDAVILSNQHNMRYFTDYGIEYGYVILSRNGKFVLTDSRFTAELRNNMRNDFTVVEITRQNSFDIIKKHLTGCNIGVDTSINYDDYVLLKNNLSEYNFVGVSVGVEHLRMTKSRSEIESIVKAQDIAEKALEQLMPYMKQGVTERELQMRLDYFAGMLGSEKSSFDTIVAFGENSAYAHAKPGNRELRDGDIIMLDYGATFNGYHSDMTRCYVYGKVSKKIAEMYDIVLTAQNMAIEAISEGKLARDIDKVARDYITTAGYGKEFGHSLGHGVGLEIHEAPTLSMNSETILKENMVVTVEPGIYVEGLGGIRIEDMFIVGVGNIAKMPKHLQVINKK